MEKVKGSFFFLFQHNSCAFTAKILERICCRHPSPAPYLGSPQSIIRSEFHVRFTIGHPLGFNLGLEPAVRLIPLPGNQTRVMPHPAAGPPWG